MFIFFFTHYFFFKQPQRFLYKKSATLYQKHLQITYEIIDFEKFLYNISGVVAKHHKKHILYTDKSALCLAFCTLYKTLLFFFYQCFCFWYPKNKTPMKNIPWYTSHYYVAPQVYNLQQHLYIHTLQALQTSIAYSKKKTPQASKIVKSFKQTPYPRFSSFISRSAMILPQHVGHVFFVHNGKTYNTVSISPKMLGHKFGEFASTRKKPFHKKKK